MQEKDSIQILEKLDKGKFCNIGLPLTNSMRSNVTAVYLGKDKDGRYNFYDGGGAVGTFKMTEKFIRERDIKKTSEDKTHELYKELNKEEKRVKHKERDYR